MKAVVVIIFICALLVSPHLQAQGEAADQYACVKLKNGQFRLVDNPEECNPSEFMVIIDVSEESELNGEMCWLNSGEDCVLKLRFKRQGGSYSLTGNETCTADDMTTAMHVYGSGREENEELRIGVTYTALKTDTDMVASGILHEGRVFTMDLASGFGLVQYRESDDAEECGENAVPCVIQDIYTPVDCP